MVARVRVADNLKVFFLSLLTLYINEATQEKRSIAVLAPLPTNFAQTVNLATSLGRQESGVGHIGGVGERAQKAVPILNISITREVLDDADIFSTK